MKRRILCSCVNVDGSKCGRSVTDGSNPPICHLHRNVALGNPHNGGTLNGPSDDVDVEKLLRQLIRSKEPNVQLKALAMWQDLRAERRSDAHTRAKTDALLHAMSESERDLLRDALDWLYALKDSVYRRCPDLDPDASTLAWRRGQEIKRRAEAHEREEQQRASGSADGSAPDGSPLPSGEPATDEVTTDELLDPNVEFEIVSEDEDADA